MIHQYLTSYDIKIVDGIGVGYSKEVWKLNFRQYGQMGKAQPGRSSATEKVKREKRRCGEDKRWRKSEEAGVRKGMTVAKHCVFPLFCGSGGSKNKLAKAAGAEPPSQMRDEKVHAVVARSTF